MTGSQQSGPGGNPEFDTPQDRKSVGGAEKAMGPATANPGKDYGDSPRDRPSQPAETRQNRQQGQGQQGQGQQGQGQQGQGQEGQGGQQRQGDSQQTGQQQAGSQERERNSDPSGLQQDDDESADIEQRAGANTDRTGSQQRRDTGTPGSSDQAQPREDDVMYDENKSAK